MPAGRQPSILFAHRPRPRPSIYGLESARYKQKQIFPACMSRLQSFVRSQGSTYQYNLSYFFPTGRRHLRQSSLTTLSEIHACKSGWTTENTTGTLICPAATPARSPLNRRYAANVPALTTRTVGRRISPYASASSVDKSASKRHCGARRALGPVRPRDRAVNTKHHCHWAVNATTHREVPLAQPESPPWVVRCDRRPRS